MANIRSKSIQDLNDWNMKELRKLRITLNNRIESLKARSKPRELPDSHPLKNFGVEECETLLERVKTAERTLAKG